jgi:hypothetical protein
LKHELTPKRELAVGVFIVLMAIMLLLYIGLVVMGLAGIKWALDFQSPYPLLLTIVSAVIIFMEYPRRIVPRKVKANGGTKPLPPISS